MNGGKPIKESRDVDVPLAAAHFFYYAGWADKLEYAFPGRTTKPLGVARADHPVELPVVDAGVEDRAGPRDGQHRRAEAGRDDPAHRAGVRARSASRSDCLLVSSTSSRGPVRRGPRSSAIPDVDKVAFTGSTEVGKEIQRTVAGTGKHLTLELGGKAANIVFDDAPLDQAIEGIVNGIFFNQGHVCCAGSRLLVQESIAERVHGQAQATPGHLEGRRPTRQEHRHRRDQLPRPTRQDQASWSGSASTRGPSSSKPPCEIPDRGFWFPPTVFTGVSQSHRIAQEEIFGPVLSVITFRTEDEAVEKANNTPYRAVGGRVDREGLAHPVDGRSSARRRRVGQHVQSLRPDEPVRRLQGIRLRS